MKKIIVTSCFLGLCLFGYQDQVYAQETEEPIVSEESSIEQRNSTQENELENSAPEIQEQEDVEIESNLIVQEDPIIEQPEIKNGLVNENGTYVLYKENQVENYTGFIPASTIQKTIFLNQGIHDNTFTGIAKNTDGKWVFARNGVLDTSFTGVAKSISNDKYYHVNKGILDWNFTGLSKSVTNGKWYFSRKGALDWDFTGVAKSIENGKWYHANKGELDWTFTGLSKSVENDKWYFSRKGALDWSFTGVAKSVANNKWYHAKKGELDWNFTGLSKSVENGKWYFSKKGALDWSFTGLSKSIADGKWYHSSKGALDWTFTGLSKSIANGKYYYSKNGALDWNYYGQAKNIDNKKIYGVAAGEQYWDSKSLSSILSRISAPSLDQLRQLARSKYGMDEQAFIIALGWLAGDNLQGQDDYASYYSACAPINAFRRSGTSSFVRSYTSWGSYYSYSNYVYRANRANPYIRKIMMMALTNLDTRPAEANGVCAENGYNAHSINSAIYKVRYRSAHILPYGGYDGWFGVWSY